jgi:predicted XRE-type DNA-binding protein
MSSVGAGVTEIRVHTRLEHRVFYVAKCDDAVYVLHAFEKRTRATPPKALSETPMTTKIRRSSGNVFKDLGFAAAEATNLKLRSDLMIRLSKLIDARGLTQAQAATLFGVTQPRISDLVRGKIDRFSIDTLIAMLGHAGVGVQIVVGRSKVA